MNVLIRGIILTVLMVALGAPCALAIDPPHDATNAISCANCHYAGSSINSVGFTNFCNSCHRAGGMAQLHPFSPNDASNIFNNVTPDTRTGVIQQHSHNWGGGLDVPRAGAVTPSPTSPLTYAPLIGLSCDRCHSLHIPIQSATNSFPFLRTLKDQDQICFECHSPRKTTNQTTGSHPVTMTYTTAIKKFARYTTKFYTTPVNANPSNSTSAMRLNGGQVICSTCHGVHFSDSNSATFDNASSALLNRLVPGDGFLLRTDLHGATPNAINICTNCHKGKFAHNGKGQNVQCADCHAGHVDEADGTKANVWLVRRYMTYSTALTGKVDNRKLAIPTFFQSTTVKNYKDANGTGVCESCHTPPPTVAEHTQPGANCNLCHYHSNAAGSFAAAGGSCTSCHGQPPSLNVAGGPNGYASGYTTVNEALSAHASHAGGTVYNYTCNDCHKGNTHANGNFQQVFLSPAGTLAATAGATPAYNTTARTCATNYCHSNGAPRGGTTTYAAPVAWANGKGAIVGTAGECSACHAALPATNVHTKHINPTTGKGYACDVCHNLTVTGSATVKDKTKHVNGVKEVSFSGTLATGSTFDTTTANCTSACHTNGKGAAPVTVPNWTNAVTGACGTCHKATGASPIDTVAHLQHLTTTYGPLLGTAVNACQACHTYTTDTAATHVNGVIEAPVTNCTASCHKNGITIAAWTGGRVTCESCHSGSLSVIGVTAPDKTLNATKGHGQATFTASKACQSCHDQNAAHISGVLGDNMRLLLANTNVQCASCHKDAVKVPTAAFRNVSTHFTTKGGPQDMLCKQCHDPHGTGNLHMVRTQLKGTWANATTYTINYTVSNVGMVDLVKNRGLCQVCHTKTAHYRAGVPESSHPTSGCLDCHTHGAAGGAFKPKNTCDACHGYPPAPRNVAGLTFGTAGNYQNAAFDDYSGGGGGHLIGAHIPATAVASQGWANCTMCHNSGSAAHKTITPLKTNIANVTVVVDPKYKFNATKLINYSGAKLVNPGNKTGQCTNVECHFQASPRWSKVR